MDEPDRIADMPKHSVKAESDEPISLEFNKVARAMREYLLNLSESGTLKTLPFNVKGLLLEMLTAIDDEAFPPLVAQCSNGWLAERAGRSVGHIPRLTGVMLKAKVIRLVRRGGGSHDNVNVYEFCAPAQRVIARQRAEKYRAQARGYGGKVARRAQ